MSVALAEARPAPLTGGGWRRTKERLIQAAFASAAAVSVVVLAGIVWVLASGAWSAFTLQEGLSLATLSPEQKALFSAEELAALPATPPPSPEPWGDFLAAARWNPAGSTALWGVGSMVGSTLLVTTISLLIAGPVGVGAAAWLAFVAPRSVREVLKPVIEVLAAVPSVVVGFIGIVAVGPLIAGTFGVPSGLGALNGGILLAVMSLPTIVSLTEDAIGAVPRDYVQASLALGADRWQTLVRVVLPAARSGIVAALMLGMGRAIGETMTVLMACGNAIAVPDSIFDPVRTLTATIAIELGEVPHGSRHYFMLFAVGAVLFLLTLGVNLASERFARQGVRA